MGLHPLSEAEFQSQVRQVAEIYRWGMHHNPESRRADPGFPDLVLVRPPRILFVELKTDRGRLDKRERTDKKGKPLWNQQDWKDALEGCPGVEYYLWRPRDFDEIERVLA